MAGTEGPSALLTLPDVAALAGVQRPVVSMWRSRSARSERPFPAPRDRAGRQELFGAEEVADWLVATGRGNDVDLRQELAIIGALGFAERASGARGGEHEGLSALLALKAASGVRLTGLTSTEILDLADDVDPHDAVLYREVEALGDGLLDLAAIADDVASAAYSSAGAMEALLSRRFRLGPRAYADTALAEPTLDAVARLVVALLGLDPDAGTALVDPSGGSDLLVAVRRRLGDADLPSAALGWPGEHESPLTRLAGRRLLAHGWRVNSLGRDDGGGLTLRSPSLVVAQYPAPVRPELSDTEILTAIDDAALAMGDRDRAVVVAPARVLADDARSSAVDSIRSTLLRSGRVRAVVRLPEKGWVTHPRERLALWVIGATPPGVALGDRWTTVADLGDLPLDEAVAEDLVTDVVAALGDRETVHGHAFRFARPVQTSSLLASAGSLVGMPRPRLIRPRTAPAETALAVQNLVDEVNRPSVLAVRAAVEHREPTSTRVVTLGELVGSGAARVLPGHRLDPADVGPPAEGAVRVIGPTEVRGGARIGERAIDRLAFSARYPAGRYTEPGDVVFCTSPQVDAVVDVEGYSVVEAPARVLRLDRAREPGAIPAAVARDLRGTPVARRWRALPVRLMPRSQSAALAAALDDVAAARAEAERRLEALSDLAATLTDGVATGALVLTPAPADENAREDG